jgi:hypothetical protein
MVKVEKAEVSARRILKVLPKKGWGVLREHVLTVLWLQQEGYIKAQYTHIPHVFQARLTAEGRKLFK